MDFSNDTHRDTALFTMPYRAAVLDAGRVTTVILTAADAQGNADDVTVLHLSNS